MGLHAKQESKRGKDKKESISGKVLWDGSLDLS
jgi:hypothetical protein